MKGRNVSFLTGLPKRGNETTYVNMSRVPGTDEGCDRELDFTALSLVPLSPLPVEHNGPGKTSNIISKNLKDTHKLETEIG